LIFAPEAADIDLGADHACAFNLFNGWILIYTDHSSIAA